MALGLGPFPGPTGCGAFQENTTKKKEKKSRASRAKMVFTESSSASRFDRHQTWHTNFSAAPKNSTANLVKKFRALLRKFNRRKQPGLGVPAPKILGSGLGVRSGLRAYGVKGGVVLRFGGWLIQLFSQPDSKFYI